MPVNAGGLARALIGNPPHTGELVDKDLTVTARVLAPSGEAIFANNATGRFGRPAWPDLPAGLDIGVEIQLRATEFGTHEIVISAQSDDGATMEGRTQFYVMELPAVAR